MEYWNHDGIVKGRHSRENGNPGNSNYMKILDSCLRRNDKNLLFRLFTRSSIMEYWKNQYKKIVWLRNF